MRITAADSIGWSASWTTKTRNRFIKEKGLPQKGKKGGRRNQLLSKEEEELFMAPYMDEIKAGSYISIREAHRRFEREQIASLSTIYGLFRRHGWCPKR